jgi:hypothetical protein
MVWVVGYGRGKGRRWNGGTMRTVNKNLRKKCSPQIPESDIHVGVGFGV